MDLKIWIKYSTNQVGGSYRSDAESRHPEMTQLVVESVSKSPSGFFKHSMNVTPEVLAARFVYLVIVRYQDGDTFGTSHGKFLFYSVRATPEEAIKDRKIICTPAKNRKEYREWEGYFEKLEDVEIRLVELKP